MKGFVRALRGNVALFGWSGALSKGLAVVRRQSIFRVPLPERGGRPAGHVLLRRGTSDIATFVKVIRDEEYAFSPRTSPRTIVDAGANIGLTSVFFAHRFPDAKILAVEPEESNHSLLVRNVAPYTNVVPIRAALWGEDAVIHVENPGLGNWGFRTRGTSLESIDTVRGLTVETLMRENGMESLDILKLDIEGAEREVLSASSSWIDRVGMIVAEMHDRYEGGCSRAFYRATSEFEWEWTKGENLFAVRGGMVPAGIPGFAARIEAKQ